MNVSTFTQHLTFNNKFIYTSHCEVDQNLKVWVLFHNYIH